MANKIKYGLSNVHYAKLLRASDGTISYDTPKKLPGAVKLTVSAEGEISKFYADNVVYYQASKNNGYSGSIEIADITRNFQIDILGYVEDTNGALVEKDNIETSEFALMYEVEGDVSKRKGVLYDCKVTRPSTEASTTEDSTTPQTDSLDITATGREDNNNVKAIMELSDTNQTVFDAFYNSVYEPTIA